MIKGAKIAIYDVLKCFMNKFTKKKIDSQLYSGWGEGGKSVKLSNLTLSSGFTGETLFKVELMMHSFISSLNCHYCQLYWAGISPE